MSDTRGPATHNLTLAKLRSLVRHLQRIDHMSWLLDIGPVLVTAYRNTTGPGAPEVARLRAAAPRPSDRADVTRGEHARRLPVTAVGPSATLRGGRHPSVRSFSPKRQPAFRWKS